MAAQLMATNSPPRAGSSRGPRGRAIPCRCRCAPSSMTETSALATRSMVRATLSISGAAVMIEPSTVAPSPPRASSRRFSASISWRWKARRDDQAELVDVDRLAVEIIGAERDRLERAFARAVARGDDDLGVGLEREDLGQRGEALGGAVGIGRQAEVERDHRGLVQAQQVDRLRRGRSRRRRDSLHRPISAGAAGPRHPRRSAGREGRWRRSCGFPFGSAAATAGG